VFTCQLTAELPAFCTVAVNCTVVLVKGCAEVGDTVTVTCGGGPEEVRPPHEIKNIVNRRGSTRGRHKRSEPHAEGSKTSHV
jgi:hypothetical protein